MSEFDKVRFEALMGEAVSLHGRGRYAAALDLSTEAYFVAPGNSIEQGRAARDCGARCDRLGRPEAAKAWADEALNIHDAVVKSSSEPTYETLRERSVSAMYVGVNGLRQFLEARANGEALESSGTLATMRLAWQDIASAKAKASGINGFIDQYEINAARRVSLAETFLGSKQSGLAIGLRGVVIAPWSESPKLSSARRNLSPKQRIEAKTKALLGSAAAVGVGLASLAKVPKMQRFTAKLARKVL